MKPALIRQDFELCFFFSGPFTHIVLPHLFEELCGGRALDRESEYEKLAKVYLWFGALLEKAREKERNQNTYK